MQSRLCACIMILLLFASCKKDSPVTNTSNATLANDKSVLVPTSYTFASSNGILPGTGTAFPFNIGGERVIAMNISGQSDNYQLLCYIPGKGLEGLYSSAGAPTPVFSTMDFSHTGIIDQLGHGNYDLMSPYDKIVPYDMAASGEMKHIICYRPGSSLFYIYLWNPKSSGSPWQLIQKSTIGVGNAGQNFDLSNKFDVIVPFDFYHTGRQTELLCYRPGGGKIMVLANTGTYGTPNFVPVLSSNAGIGLGSNLFNLLGTMDQIIPWDVSHTGKTDGILAYRTGGGIIGTYVHPSGTSYFSNIAFSSSGIPASTVYPYLAYDLRDPALNDRIIRYWTNGGLFGPYTGALVTRAGHGLAYSYNNLDVSTNALSFNSSHGIGTGSNPSTYYDLSSATDQVYAFDGSHSGQPNTLCCWRPSTGIVWIISGAFNKVF